MERRFTSEGRDFRTPDVKTYSNDKARNIYFHSPAVLAPAKAAPYKPIKSFLMESLSTLDPVGFIRYASVYKDFKTPADFAGFIASQSRDDEGEVKE